VSLHSPYPGASATDVTGGPRLTQLYATGLFTVSRVEEPVRRLEGGPGPRARPTARFCVAVVQFETMGR
jgi:hypothetical protein